jgi:ankyrin repeat protein
MMLHETVRTLDLDAIRCELERSSREVNSLDDHGQSPLHWAVMAGSLEAVTLLLEFGGDPNLPSAEGAFATPYWHAKEDFGLVEIANLLELHGAKSMPNHKFQRTPDGAAE